MLNNLPPVSNAERQRQFRKRNPGYSKRRHARIRAGFLAYMATPAIAAPPKEMLALPAPVEVLELPGLNLIAFESGASLVRAIVAKNNTL